MRTTLTLDDDILTAARQMAEESGETVGKVISRGFRESLTSEMPGTYDEVLGIHILPRRQHRQPITTEYMDKLREEYE